MFVQGIPLDLNNQGLTNLFSQAGPVEQAKVIPPKNPAHTVTFGFVRFKRKADAAAAIEMFNQYTLNNKKFFVRFSNTKATMSTSTSRDTNSSISQPTENRINENGDDEWTNVNANRSVVGSSKATVVSNASTSRDTSSFKANVGSIDGFGDNYQNNGRCNLVLFYLISFLI